jgi:hypothetical protein
LLDIVPRNVFSISAAMPENRDQLIFTVLERAAAQGRRCPTNAEIAAQLSEHGPRIAGPTVPAAMQRLAREGAIVVRLYGSNYRDVCICKGPHKGKATLPPAHGKLPHIVIDQEERARRDKLQHQKLHGRRF